MQISIETTSALERRLTIQLPSEAFETQINDRLVDAATKVNLPGFRPGKVPMKEVRRRYGKAVRAEVAGELMQASFVEAVQKEDLTPAGSPNLEVVKMDPGIDFEFTATFEVFPVVQLADFGKVNVIRPQAEVDDGAVEELIENLRAQRKTFEEVERAAADGDQVTLDFTGKIDDEEFEGGTGEDVSFEVGAGQMIEDFDLAVVGLKSGDESSFAATFPDDYNAEEMQGKTAQFSVVIKAVKEVKLPELDEEFFKSFNVEEGGLEAFKVDVRENMQRELQAAITNQVKTQVIDQLGDLHEIPLPQSMIDRELVQLKQQMLQQFQGYSQDQPGGLPDLPDELFLDQAKKRVNVGLVINEVVSSADLKADEAKVRERVETLAAGYAETEQVISYYMNNPEQRQQIEMSVLEDQVIDHILGEAQVETLSSNYADVIAGKAIPPQDSKEDSKEESDQS